jgi:hypothetical protein
MNFLPELTLTIASLHGDNNIVDVNVDDVVPTPDIITQALVNAEAELTYHHPATFTKGQVYHPTALTSFAPVFNKKAEAAKAVAEQKRLAENAEVAKNESILANFKASLQAKKLAAQRKLDEEAAEAQRKADEKAAEAQRKADEEAAEAQRLAKEAAVYDPPKFVAPKKPTKEQVEKARKIATLSANVIDANKELCAATNDLQNKNVTYLNAINESMTAVATKSQAEQYLFDAEMEEYYAQQALEAAIKALEAAKQTAANAKTIAAKAKKDAEVAANNAEKFVAAAKKAQTIQKRAANFERQKAEYLAEEKMKLNAVNPALTQTVGASVKLSCGRPSTQPLRTFSISRAAGDNNGNASDSSEFDFQFSTDL